MYGVVLKCRYDQWTNRPTLIYNFPGVQIGHRQCCRPSSFLIFVSVSVTLQCLNDTIDGWIIKAKFHYAIIVADRSEAGRRPVADLLARASSLLASKIVRDMPNSSSQQVCDHPRTCLRLRMDTTFWEKTTEVWVKSSITDEDDDSRWQKPGTTETTSTTHCHHDIQLQHGHLRAYTALPHSLWPPYVIGQVIYIFILWFLLLLLLFSSPNLSGRRLDVYHTSTHGVALVRI